MAFVNSTIQARSSVTKRSAAVCLAKGFGKPANDNSSDQPQRKARKVTRLLKLRRLKCLKVNTSLVVGQEGVDAVFYVQRDWEVSLPSVRRNRRDDRLHADNASQMCSL